MSKIQLKSVGNSASGESVILDTIIPAIKSRGSPGRKNPIIIPVSAKIINSKRYNPIQIGSDMDI